MSWSADAQSLVAHMTSDSAPSPQVASANAEDYPAWYAFDGGATKYWAAGNYLGPPWYVKIDMGASNTKATKYTIYLANYSTSNSPATWTFQGSNDNSSWTTLDTRTSQTFVDGTKSSFSFSNSTAYRYYMLNITAQNGTGSVGPVIYQMEVCGTLGVNEAAVSLSPIFFGANF